MQSYNLIEKVGHGVCTSLTEFGGLLRYLHRIAGRICCRDDGFAPDDGSDFRLAGLIFTSD